MKWVVPTVAALILLIIGIVYALFYVPPQAEAVLYVETQGVEVDTGKGWVPAQDEMELKRHAKVRTTTGTASLVLLGGEILHLEPGTEVELATLTGNAVSIAQATGETWHKILKISGITQYEVETPTTVATVRGTEFYVILEGGETILVEEGALSAALRNNKDVQHALQSGQMLQEGQVLAFLENPRAERFRQLYVELLRKTRWRELERNQRLVTLGKKLYGVTEDDIRTYFADVDAGRRDVEHDYALVPGVYTYRAKPVYLLTKAIRRAQGQ